LCVCLVVNILPFIIFVALFLLVQNDHLRQFWDYLKLVERACCTYNIASATTPFFLSQQTHLGFWLALQSEANQCTSPYAPCPEMVGRCPVHAQHQDRSIFHVPWLCSIPLALGWPFAYNATRALAVYPWRCPHILRAARPLARRRTYNGWCIHLLLPPQWYEDVVAWHAPVRLYSYIFGYLWQINVQLSVFDQTAAS
jgi:hypothetical protein